MRQFASFLRVLLFPPPMKLTATIAEILLRVALDTITLTLTRVDYFSGNLRYKIEDGLLDGSESLFSLSKSLMREQPKTVSDTGKINI